MPSIARGDQNIIPIQWRKQTISALIQKYALCDLSRSVFITSVDDAALQTAGPKHNC